MSPSFFCFWAYQENKSTEDSFNQFIYNFYPQNILILNFEGIFTKVVKWKHDMSLNVFESVLRKVGVS